MVSLQHSLAASLATSLPAGLRLSYYHISTPPTPCASLYAPAPGRKPERTYSESHSLTVTIDTPKTESVAGEVAIYAIELVLYTTAHLSTLFVSKADSTGYASLPSSDRTAGSVVRSITSTFISWLVAHRHRPDRKLVLSLFARAQGQYLFPGSVENGKKHVLDDRQLVKWWCKTLDPVVREYALELASRSNNSREDKDESSSSEEPEICSKAYLIVPGHDSHETRSFFPPPSTPSLTHWTNTHPLPFLTRHPTAPPRCLIPMFPDDPKARFLLELDEEIPDAALSQHSTASPAKRNAGMWKSVRTLEQFWEMMAFRQECCSGRLVGFIWVVFTPTMLLGDGTVEESADLSPPSPLKRPTQEEDTACPPDANRCKSSNTKKHKPRLTGPIHPRLPRVKTSNNTTSTLPSQQPETTRFYHSPLPSRGTIVLLQKDYDRIHEVLLRLDFSDLSVSCASTKKWIDEAAVIAGVQQQQAKTWAVEVLGTKEPGGSKRDEAPGPGPGLDGTVEAVGRRSVNMLAPKKRSRPEAAANGEELVQQQQQHQTAPPTNTLGSNLVRKKPKLGAKEDGQPAVVVAAATATPSAAAAKTTILPPSLVRKKPK